MCIQCHSKLSNEKITEDYQKFKNKIDECKSVYELGNIFMKLNSTSISHMILASLYVNGSEARHLAIYCFKKFIDWYKLHKSIYNSKLYWIKRHLHDLFLSKEEQKLNNINRFFKYKPNITNLETIYSNLSEFNRHTFMNCKYAELSDTEYTNTFFGNTNKEENNTTVDDTDNTNDTDDENKVCNDSIEMQNEIFQFIYKYVKIENNNECDCAYHSSHYLFNRNHLFILSGILGGIIGLFIGNMIIQ